MAEQLYPEPLKSVPGCSIFHYSHGCYLALPKDWLEFIYLTVGRYNINNAIFTPEVLDIFSI